MAQEWKEFPRGRTKETEVWGLQLKGTPGRTAKERLTEGGRGGGL